MPKADVKDLGDLTPLQLTALACVIKDKHVSAAKASIQDGSSEQVDFRVRIQATVMKGISTPAGTIKGRPTVNFTDFTTICAVFRELGIGPKRIRDALNSIATLRELQPDSELSAVFDEHARKIVETMPDIERPVSGRSGAVTVTGTAALI